jgi:uncharacterized tellurite resistance protein B-like protein
VSAAEVPSAADVLRRELDETRRELASTKAALAVANGTVRELEVAVAGLRRVLAKVTAEGKVQGA